MPPSYNAALAGFYVYKEDIFLQYAYISVLVGLADRIGADDAYPSALGVDTLYKALVLKIDAAVGALTVRRDIVARAVVRGTCGKNN